MGAGQPEQSPDRPAPMEIALHFYDFNIGDYAKKTSHLTNEEDIAYRRALDLYYDTEQPLPITHGLARLSRRLRVNENALKNVIEEFFPDGKNKHADEKIEEYHAYLNKQKANGSKGGRPKLSQNNPVVSQNNPVPSQPLTTKPLTTKPIEDQKHSAPASRKPSVIFPPEISEQLKSDFIAQRKAKKSPLTQTALDGIAREAAKANLSLNDALDMCCQRGWAGFKSEWVTNDANARGSPSRQEKFDPVAFVNQGRKTAGGGNDGFINGTAERVA